MMERAATGFLGMMGKAARGLLSLALVLCMCVPSAAVLALAGGAGQAAAVENKEKVTIVHPGTHYRYSDGGYSGYGTARMYVASNLDPLICAQPDMKSLPSGTYTAHTNIQDYLYDDGDGTYTSEADAETAADMIRTLMYYCYPESEGYDKSILSSLDYIDDDDTCADTKHTIVVTLHIALSALYGNSTASAAHSGSSKATSSFTSFVYDTICGGQEGLLPQDLRLLPAIRRLDAPLQQHEDRLRQVLGRESGLHALGFRHEPVRGKLAVLAQHRHGGRPHWCANR